MGSTVPKWDFQGKAPSLFFLITKQCTISSNKIGHLFYRFQRYRVLLNYIFANFREQFWLVIGNLDLY